MSYFPFSQMDGDCVQCPPNLPYNGQCELLSTQELWLGQADEHSVPQLKTRWGNLLPLMSE